MTSAVNRCMPVCMFTPVPATICSNDPTRHIASDFVCLFSAFVYYIVALLTAYMSMLYYPFLLLAVPRTRCTSLTSRCIPFYLTVLLPLHDAEPQALYQSLSNSETQGNLIYFLLFSTKGIDVPEIKTMWAFLPVNDSKGMCNAL